METIVEVKLKGVEGFCTSVMLRENDAYENKFIYNLDKSAAKALLENLDNGPVLKPFSEHSREEQQQMISRYSKERGVPLFMPWFNVRENKVGSTITDKQEYLVFFGGGHETFVFLEKFADESFPVLITEDSAKNINKMCDREVCSLMCNN